MSKDLDPLIAFRRSERALAEQIAQWESLDYGVAFTAPNFAPLPEANQLRDVWLADVDGETVFARVEAYFTERGLTCHSWTPASGQPVEPVEAMLLSVGWCRVQRQVMHWTTWDIVPAEMPVTLRILPARAMPKAYRATFDEADPLDAVRARAAFERLNDSNLDAFVATVDGKPAGRVSYLSVGDAARILDVFVLPECRRREVGRAMMEHVLQLARRLLPKVVVFAIHAGDAAGRALLASTGFSPTAVDTYYLRDG